MRHKFLLFLFTLTLFNCKENNSTLYIGTYTSGASEGIYKINFNTKTGKLSDLQLVATTKNPSFICYSPNKKHLYAVGEDSKGIVSAFKIEDNGSLTLINSVKSYGGAPCHISVSENGNKLAASNYVGGNLALYNINHNGSLNDASQVFDHNIESEKSHVHSAQFYKDNLFVADLGRNAIYLYKKENDGNYKLKGSSLVEMTENAGPRHFTYTKDANYMYVINEYASTITSAQNVGDQYKLINHTSTLLNDYIGNNSCADIHLSQDEHFLYGSNRGENTIAVFKRNIQNGTIEKIQNASVHGNWPRNFTIDPSGKFLLVANQKSDNISVFKIDASTGKLSFLKDYKAPTPVCLLF